MWLSGGFRVFLDRGCLLFLLLLNYYIYKGLLVQAKAIYYYMNFIIKYKFVVDYRKSEVFVGKV